MDLKEKLSAHFTLGEMVRSEMAVRRGLDNAPPPEVVSELRLLCEEILERVRAVFSKPVIMTSGYRSPLVNLAIGGSLTSQHPKGQAADFGVLDVADTEVVERIRESAIPYDQLILEFPPNGWVHISRSVKPRRQTLIAHRGDGGRTVYEPWVG